VNFKRLGNTAIEDDWKPQGKTQVDSEVDYEKPVRELAGRLQEAQEEARKQSKLTHDKKKNSVALVR
jgi:hypothetical protein